MNLHERIIIDPEILVGKSVVKGTRLSVDLLLSLLAQGWTEAEILRNYPGLQRDDLLACWTYAGDVQNSTFDSHGDRLSREQLHERHSALKSHKVTI